MAITTGVEFLILTFVALLSIGLPIAVLVLLIMILQKLQAIEARLNK